MYFYRIQPYNFALSLYPESAFIDELQLIEEAEAAIKRTTSLIASPVSFTFTLAQHVSIVI